MSYSEKGYHRVNRIVATLFDERTVAKGVDTTVVAASGTYHVSVTIPNLNFVEEVLHIEVHTDPAIEIESGFGNKNISGNVVGISIAGVSAGTTLITEIIAVGV